MRQWFLEKWKHRFRDALPYTSGPPERRNDVGIPFVEGADTEWENYKASKRTRATGDTDAASLSECLPEGKLQLLLSEVKEANERISNLRPTRYTRRV